MDYTANDLSDLDRELAAIERDLERHSALQDMSSTADHSGFSSALTVADISAMGAPMAGIEDFDRRINALIQKAAAIDGIAAGIESMGKISLRDVNSLENIVPGMFTGRIDTSMMTMSPSTSGYAAGLEAINWAKVGKWGIIGALVAAIIAILIKVFGGGKGGDSGIAKKVADFIDQVNKQERAGKAFTEDLNEQAEEAKKGWAKQSKAYEDALRKAFEERHAKMDADAARRKAEREAMDAKHSADAAERNRIWKEQQRLDKIEDSLRKFIGFLRESSRFDDTLIPKDGPTLSTMPIEHMYKEDYLRSMRRNFIWQSNSGTVSHIIDHIKVNSELVKKFSKVTDDRQLAYGFIEDAKKATESIFSSASLIMSDRSKAKYDTDKLISIWNKSKDEDWDRVWSHEPSAQTLIKTVAGWKVEADAAAEVDVSILEQIYSTEHGDRTAVDRKVTEPPVGADVRDKIAELIKGDGFHQGNYLEYFSHYNSALKRFSNENPDEYNVGLDATLKEIHESETDPKLKEVMIRDIREIKQRFDPMLNAMTAYMHLCQRTLVSYARVLSRVNMALNQLRSYYHQREEFQTHQMLLVKVINHKTD